MLSQSEKDQLRQLIREEINGVVLDLIHAGMQLEIERYFQSRFCRQENEENGD